MGITYSFIHDRIMTKKDFFSVLYSIEESELDQLLEPLHGMTSNDFKAMINKYGAATIQARQREAETERLIADPHAFDDVAKRMKGFNPNR